MSTSSSTTYVTRAVPASGPSTSEFPAVRDPASRGGWPPQHHRPFLVAAGIGFGLAVLTLFIYGVMASHPGVALPARTLVHGLGITLLMLSGLSLLLAYTVRAHDRAITAATERGVTEVHGLDTLHPVIQGVDIHLSDIVGRLEAVVGQRVDQLGQRVDVVEAERDRLVGAVLDQLGRIETGVGQFRERLEAVEREVAEQQPTREVLSGIAGWAMSVDGRLAELRADRGEDVPAQPNGHHDDPGELSEGIRGYLLGFYDREKGPD